MDPNAAIERAQSALVARFAWLSPVIAVRQASMALAGTDLSAYQRFLVEAERYRYELIQALNRMHAEQVHYEGDRDQRISRENWKALPQFRADARERAETAGDMRAIAVLASWWLVLIGLLAWRGRRLGGA
jgi:ABC-2 type transport system permease protein